MSKSASEMERMLPLYQGLMGTFYDHRAADVVRSDSAQLRQNQPRYLTDEEKADPTRLAMPQYWVRESLVDESLPDWYLGFSNICSPTNERTLVPIALPHSGVGHAIPLVLFDDNANLRASFLACLSSFVVDYLARQKVGGVNMTYFFVRQFAVLPPSVFRDVAPWDPEITVQEWIAPRVAELVSTAIDMTAFADELGVTGAPFIWDPERRELIRAELDAAFFHLYGVSREDVEYIMDTFPIVKRKDEAAFGEYRTKRLILEAYDRMDNTNVETT